MKRYFAAVGSWGFGPELKGLSIYQFNPDTADMTLLSTDYEKASIGALRYAGNQVLYFTEERGEKEGQVGGGGTLYAVRIDPDGRMQEISRSDSLAAEPAYLAMRPEHLNIPSICIRTSRTAPAMPSQPAMSSSPIIR